MIESSSGTCEHMDCYVPDTSCAAGSMHYIDCPHFKGKDRSEDAPLHGANDESFPWTGRAMGVIDSRFISATRRPHIVGFAGAADAGKTTLLCLLFLSLYRGREIGDFSFAGSFTLSGWENIAQNMQLNSGETIQFPPHTTSSGRSPGLLHLRTMHNDDRLQDSLLTDASGEWFSAWTDNPKDDQAEGARWIAKHADRMLIVADTDALTGTKSGSARRALEFLIRRVHHEFGAKRVALVWTKTDIKRSKDLRTEVEALFRSCFEESPIFETGIPDEKTNGNEETLKQLTEVFTWAFNPTTYSISVNLPESKNNDPFISYRSNL